MEEYSYCNYLKDIWAYSCEKMRQFFGFDNWFKSVYTFLSLIGGLAILFLLKLRNLAIDNVWENLAIGFSGVILLILIFIFLVFIYSPFIIHKVLRDKELKRIGLISNIRIREINNSDEVEIELFSFSDYRFSGSLYLVACTEFEKLNPMKFLPRDETHPSFELSRSLAKNIVIAKVIDRKAFFLGENDRTIPIKNKSNLIVLRLDGNFSNSEVVASTETYWNLEFDNEKIKLFKANNYKG